MLAWLPQLALTVGACRRMAGIVEHIVVDQRGRVDHLDHGGQQMMRTVDLAAGPGREQQQGRPSRLPR